MEQQIIQLSPEGWQKKTRAVVQEKLYRISINGRDMLTLVASPHEPEILITGFLYLQGIIADPGDIITLGICAESGRVAVTVRNELPEMLSPIVSSGCGGGIVFEGGAAPALEPVRQHMPPGDMVSAIQQGMARLFELAEQYAAHGGIHSAAICNATGLLLHAEDLGRHNTVDRLAGAARLRKLEISGSIMLTSGRVSSEMAAKAVRLGIAVLASRTSPTSLAIEICREYGVGLAGYVRAGKMELFANRELFSAPEE